MKIRMRNPEFPLYFIGELGFGIFLFKIVFQIRMIPVLPGIFCG